MLLLYFLFLLKFFFFNFLMRAATRHAACSRVFRCLYECVWQLPQAIIFHPHAICELSVAAVSHYAVACASALLKLCVVAVVVIMWQHSYIRRMCAA